MTLQLLWRSVIKVIPVLDYIHRLLLLYHSDDYQVNTNTSLPDFTYWTENCVTTTQSRTTTTASSTSTLILIPTATSEASLQRQTTRSKMLTALQSTSHATTKDAAHHSTSPITLIIETTMSLEGADLTKQMLGSLTSSVSSESVTPVLPVTTEKFPNTPTQTTSYIEMTSSLYSKTSHDTVSTTCRYNIFSVHDG